MKSTYIRYVSIRSFIISFFFNDTPTTEIYTLSLHDALPILAKPDHHVRNDDAVRHPCGGHYAVRHREAARPARSEEHTSELQSHSDLVCRLLLEKKKNFFIQPNDSPLAKRQSTSASTITSAT